MKWISTLSTFILLLTLTARAQELSIRGGNLLRWARGQAQVSGGDLSAQKNWFENITDLSLTFQDLQMGLRHSLYRPSEFGEEQGGLQAIDFKYLEYHYGNLGMTLGNFYTTVGRGLAVNLYRDYALNFDSNLEGFKAEFNSQYLSLLAFRGRSFQSTSPEGSRVRDNDFEGGVIKGTLAPWGSLAGYFFYTPDTTGIYAASQAYPETRMPGGFINLNLAGFGLYAETAQQYVRESNQKFKHYYGHYFSLDYAGPGFGVVVDFKDYRFKKYGSYSSGGQTSSEPLAYQNPPIVQREFTTNLLSKHLHVPLFEDEVGFQLEGNWQPRDDLGFTVNFNRSSLHRGQSIMPSLHEEDAPFWQVFLESDYTFPQNHLLRVDVGYNEEVKTAGPENARVTYFWQRKLGLAAEGTGYLDEINSFTAHLEALRLNDLQENDSFWEYYGALTYSRAPWGGVTLILETTGNPDEEHQAIWGQSTWIGGELDLNFLQSHNVLLFAGQERGGLKCTSGRCRYVDPFEGVKLTWRTTF